jgi:hypothetical protein
MKKILILTSLLIGLFLVPESNAQTAIQFAKGASSKTVSVTVAANGEKSFSVQVKSGQVINVEVSGDMSVSKTNEFSVISVNLANGEDGVDNWQDDSGTLSILTGRNGKYIFNVSNSSKRARTFKMKVSVTNDRDDYQGGEDVGDEDHQ